MKNLYEYKGYHTRVEFDYEDGLLRGKIEGITDLITFECESAKEVEAEFHSAVDDYLEFCSEIGKHPEREYRGTFNVRIAPELHRRIALVAFKNDESLNNAVEHAIERYVVQEEESSAKDGEDREKGSIRKVGRSKALRETLRQRVNTL